MFYEHGFVYAMTNAADQNQIIVYARLQDGSLRRINVYDTGGSGTGTQITDPLSSQGSIIISDREQLLFAVNAGSNSISSFSICENGQLIQTDIIFSNGVMPNCLAASQDFLYVANRGDDQTPSNITGFQFDCCGKLHRIPNATYLLSSSSAKPACLSFDASGKKLIVSELTTNQLLVFPVHLDGALGQGVVHNSSGIGPFGSTVLNHDVLLVTEAGSAALSSYRITSRLKLDVISGSIKNGQQATCWISVNKHENTAYTSNAGTNTISVYDITPKGEVTFRYNVPSNPNGKAAPIDSCVSYDGKNLYVLNGNEGTISVFHITHYGDIRLLQVVTDTDLPEIGAQGIASY